MALAHELPAWSFFNKDGWKNGDKMNLIIQFYHDKKISITDFFELSEETLKDNFQLNDKQIKDLQKVRFSLANYAFIAENLQNSGIEVIPVVSSEYSKTLKENLKKAAPIILYVKGNKQIMQEKSIAIVGSRDASEVALNFTDNIAKQASKERKVVVSGFAKGVDKQALNSSIACKGQSIIVLPQGIMTFESGFKTYYRQIIEGNVLVVSTFHPKAGWGKELAMARNPIIYGLAKEIYVAESKPSRNRQGKETKGGTYAGIMDGLKKGRIIYVRKPEVYEKNDNNFLIQSGAVAVDFNGNKLNNYEFKEDILIIAEPQSVYRSFEDNIKEILQKGQLSANDILKKLKLDWESDKLTKELKKLDFVEIRKKGNKNYFSLKGTNGPDLFEFP
ncbi:DNA-processing protein DprA [Parabacteroides pacaensis]|uniref:DNA-processing protein DprA n=1 Tax=Parabacteroides pacaensis TaxID=2086575 RepID=UPI0018FE775C|nr:DNA-processing protein DprA [Parabacteroides pacaensis]